MNEFSRDSIVSVIGAGTMGAGIAQVAATAGHSVMLFDIAAGAADRGLASIKTGLQGLVDRGKKSQFDVDEILRRISATAALEDISESALVIEAIVEDLEIKQRLFSQIEELCSDSTIIATNTSSISVSALSAKAKRPANIVGMHFFNPAAILKLVEVVSGLQTAPNVANAVFELAKTWGKKPVHTKSTPGFIVNRVARPFYAEGLRSLTEQVASVATIDALMRRSGGFKMGPLELTDLIGQDVNSAVTESVYNAFYQDKRFLPSVLQAEMAASGLLGRKSGKGFYDYSATKPEADILAAAKFSELELVTVIGSSSPLKSLFDLIDEFEIKYQKVAGSLGACDVPRIEVGHATIQLTDGRTATQRSVDQFTPNLILFDYSYDYEQTDLVAISAAKSASKEAIANAVGFFQALQKQVCLLKDVPGMQVMRTVTMLVNEAFDAVNQGVCEAGDIDIAMQAGVAYPKGPIAWGRELGLAHVCRVLGNIHQAYGEERYRISPLLSIEQHSEPR